MAVLLIPSDIRGVEYKEQVSWAAGDPGGAYTGLRCFDAAFKAEQTMHEPGYQKPEGVTGPDPAIPGGKGGVLTFKTWLRGGNGAESEFSALAKNCGIDRNANAEDLTGVIAGSAAGTLLIEDALPSEITGDGVLIDGATTDTQIRFISRKQAGVPAGDSTFDIEPDWAAGEVPVVSDDINHLDTFSPRSSALGEPVKYMAFKFYTGDGATNKHEFICTGCAGTWKLVSIGPNALPAVEWTYMVDSWVPAVVSTVYIADTFGTALPMLGCPVYIDNTETKISEFSFDPGIKLNPIPYQGGANGRAGWVYTGNDPLFEFTTLWDIDWLTGWTTPTTFQFMTQCIKSGVVDEAWALYIPAFQVMDPVTESVEGLESHKITALITDAGLDADTVRRPKWSLAITGSGA